MLPRKQPQDPSYFFQSFIFRCHQFVWQKNHCAGSADTLCQADMLLFWCEMSAAERSCLSGIGCRKATCSLINLILPRHLRFLMCSPAPLGSRGTDPNLVICVFAQVIDHRGLIHFTHQSSESCCPPPPPLRPPNVSCLCMSLDGALLYLLLGIYFHMFDEFCWVFLPWNKPPCPGWSVRELNTLWACSFSCEISPAPIFTTSGR